MAYVNSRGYLIRKSGGGKKGKPGAKGAMRDWWFVKYGRYSCYIPAFRISLSNEWAGKRVRIKIEEMEGD